MKKILKYILSGLICYVILVKIVTVFLLSPFLLNLFQFNFYALKYYGWFFYIIGWICLFFAFIAGRYVTKKENIFYSVFVFKKQSLIPNLFFTIIYYILIDFPELKSFIDFTSTPISILLLIILSIPLSIIQLVLFFHPFFSLVHFLYLKIRHKKIKNIFIWVLLLIVVTPGVLRSFRPYAQYLEFARVHNPCGIRVADVIRKSPAHLAGIRKGIVIHEINGVKMNFWGDLVAYMKTIKTDTVLTVGTDKNTYYVFPARNDNGEYKIGIYYDQEYCSGENEKK